MRYNFAASGQLYTDKEMTVLADERSLDDLAGLLWQHCPRDIEDPGLSSCLTDGTVEVSFVVEADSEDRARAKGAHLLDEILHVTRLSWVSGEGRVALTNPAAPAVARTVIIPS